MYELNGEEITLETLQGYASEFGMELEPYLDFMKEKGLVEKTDGVAVNDAAVAPQANTGLASENIFSELPEVSKEDVGLSEKQFVSKFNKTYDGLGFTAIEATYEDVQTIGAEKIGGVGFGFGDVSAFLRGKDSDYKSIRDYVTILSPPDENGVRQRKTVEVDEDFAGFATPGAKVSTKEISDFLGANIDKAEVDKEAYSFAWNIANSTPIEVDGKIKKLEDLSSEELTDHTDKLFSNIVSSGKIPGFDKVAKNINEDVEAFAADQLKTIQEKVSNGELTVEQAQAQYQANVDKEFDRLYDESPEWGKILTALEKGVGTRFKGDFSDKLRTEAENEKLPAWVVNNFSEDFVRQAYVTAKIKIPKAIDETQILFRANEIGNITEEIKELSELNPNDKYNASLFGPRLERAKRPGNRTVGGRLEYLGKRKAELTQKVVYDLIQQDGYQKKLKDIRVPSAFGKTIDDPDLTLDEWQGMLGDQAIQMLGALFSFGGSTFVQEGGGAAMEILEIEAAKKLAGKMTAKDFFGEDPDDVEGVKKKFDMGEPDPSMQLNEDGSIGTDKLSSENIEAALKQFRALPLEDTKDENGNVIPGRLTRISNIIDSGEVSLNEAFAVGGITAGLDFASNVVAVKGAGKLIPKNVLENLAKGKLKRAFKGIGKDKAVKAVSVATTTEVATESLQEVTSMEGVKLSTGYRPNKERYLKRLFEAGTQALLVTGVYVGGGQVASTSLNEGLAQIKSLPQGKMRVAINARKKALEQQQAAGFITEDQMLDQFTELNAIENTLATTEAADKLTLEEKDKLIKQYQTLRTEKENLTEAEKKFEDSKNNIDEFDLSGVPGGNVVTNEEVAVDDAKSKVQEAQQEIYKIFFANSLKTNGLRLAELVNNNDGDVLGNTNMVVFESAEEARYNLEILGFSQNTNGTWKYKGKFMKSEDTRLINKILGGQVNAGFFNIDGLKETGIFINQALQNKIKEGVENSFNAIHHETFHAFTNKLTFDQLKEITTGLNTELQALSEKDPRIKVLIKALNKQLGKFDKSKRTYHDEYLGYLSDLFHILDINQEYLSKANSISFFGMSKYFQSAHQELFQTSEQIVKMSPSQLIEFMRGFNIGKSQMTLPTVKRSTDAKEQKQDVKQQSLLSEGLYQQLTREFEESVNDYKSVVGEETAKTLAANIAAITLQGEVFNRLPKNELEGFEREDLQEIVEDFTSDPKVLENKSREHAKIKNRGIVGLLKGYNVGFEGGVMGYLNSKKRGFRLLDLRLIEFVQAHPNYGSFRKSLSDEGVISAVDETTQSLSPEDILIQQEEQKQDSDRQKRDGTIMLHEQAEKTGLKLTPAFEKAIELLGELYRNNVLTETGIKDLKKNFPKQYQEVYSLVQEAFGVKPKPGILTQTDIQNSQQMMGRLGVDFFRSYVFMNQYTKGVGIVDGKGNFVVDKNTDYLATGVPSGLQTQRITQANNIKVSEDLFYETIMRMADKGPQKGKLIPKRPKNLVIKKLKKFDDKFFNETMGIVKGDINIKEKASNVSQKHVGIHHMMTLELMSQAARRDMPRGRNFDMLSDGLPSSLASEFIYKLDPELFKEFMGTYQAINDIMGVYASNYDKGGLKEVLRNKLSAAFSNPMITKLTNVLDPIYAQYSVELAKVEKGLITIEELSTLNQTLESELVQDVVLANTLDIRNDDGTKAQSMEEVWSNIGHVTKMRQSTSLFAEKLISDFGQQKGLELIVKYLLPSVVGSGKIADGRFDVIDGALVEVGIENVGRNRKKLFKNLEDFFNSNHGINKLLDDYLNVELKQTARLDKDGNVVQQINEIFVGDTKIEINTTLLAQSSLGMLNKIKKDGGELKVKEESKKQAEEAMQYVDDIIRFFNDASYLNDTHSAMMLNGLNSDMRSPMRRAARFMYVVDGLQNWFSDFVVETYKNPGKTLEYEHMIPAQWQMMRHVAQVRDGSLTKENLSELYNQYTVAIIPKTMDLVVKNSGLNSTMQSGYEVGQHSSGRYYNNVTLGRDNMFAIRELNTQNKWGEYHQEMAGKFDYNWKSYKTATDAIATSLASEEVRGMSTFDFDDTLATTKSGIRYEMPNPSGKPQPGRKAILIAGNAGAGKTTIIDQLGLRKQGFKYVNQDIALEWLTKNSGLPKDMNEFTREQADKWRDIGSTAAVAAKNKAYKLQGKGDGVVIDGTGSVGVQFQSMARDFKDAGYDVQVVFIESSLENAIARNKGRSERRLTDATIRNSVVDAQKNKKAFREMVTFFPYSAKGFVELNTDKLKKGEPLPAEFVKTMDNFTKGYIKGRINAEQFAAEGANLLEQGAKYDFSEFNKVVEGTPGPLLSKAIERAKKFGNKNMFVLTARPAESAGPIREFLKSQGLDIPLKNITGLGNSTGEAKAMWMLEKFAEGYNDMYFVDDAMPNVEAVKKVLDQLDIKSKVRQAVPLASEDISNIFNDILETVTGIESKKRFSTTKARKRGAKKGRFRPFIPPSHEDFAGLIYNFLGKGQEGNKHKEFFENALIRPLNRAYRELNAAKQAIASDFKNLNKKFPDIKKKLKKKIAQGDFTYEDAVRVYLWDKYNHEIPGLAPTDKTNLLEAVTMDPKLQMYAETIGIISRQEDYVAPYDGWEAGTIKIDLNEAMGATGRKKYFSEYLKNAEAIFSEENMNKIEAAFGPNFREALTDMLYRIETGRNSPQGQSKNIGKLMNWLNGSVATAMFFNMRSAVLQQMSIVNFLNYADNNVFLAAKAFANQKQYWNDWATIFNSNFLKERRKGIGTDINGNDLARSLSESRNPMMKLLKVLLQSGFAPTQIADNVAIATGGSTFYRNRTNTYVKQGLDQEAAETRAFEDFIEIAEETQQSAREDKVSMQQTSWIGKTILNFQNVTSQYNRLGKKSFLDLKNRRISKGYTTQRQSDVANVSRMAYYFAVQNLAFYGLQSALFAAMFDEEDENLTEEERKRKQKVLDKKEERIINGSIDSVLRGTGIYGAIVSVLKNMAIKYADQRNVNYNHDESAVLMEALNISPVIGIKARKIVIAEKTMNYDKKLIQYMDTWDIDNPMWSSHLAYIEGTTNAPLHKIYNKVQNTRESLNAQNTMLNRVLMFFGYSKYNLGVDENIEMQLLEEEAKAAYNKRKKQEKKNSKSKPKSNTSIFLD